MHMHSALIRLPALLAAALALASAQAQPALQPAHSIAPAAVRPTTVAAFDGLWCGTGLLHEFSLRLRQQREDVLGTLVRRDRVREIEGRVEGAVLHTQSTKIGSLVLERAGDDLHITGGDGVIALVRGAVFHRASGEACTG
jgi:hypothetical protein